MWDGEGRKGTQNRNFIQVFIPALSTWNASYPVLASTLHSLTPCFFLETCSIQSHLKRKPSLSGSSLPFPWAPSLYFLSAPSHCLFRCPQASTLAPLQKCPWYSHGWPFAGQPATSFLSCSNLTFLYIRHCWPSPSSWNPSLELYTSCQLS